MNCFLSGWAIAPNHSGAPNSLNSLDSTKIVTEYKSVEKIAQNFDKIFPQNIKTLITWSMGSIIALGVLEKLQAKKIILYSPTLKFEAIDELQKLRENIILNKETALKLFARKCGISKDLVDVSYYTAKELLAGLDFLENTRINPAQVPENKDVTVVYGENDNIISPHESIEVAERLGVKAVKIAGGGHSSVLGN